MAQLSRTRTLDIASLDLTQVMAPLSYLGLQSQEFPQAHAPLNYPVVSLWVTGTRGIHLIKTHGFFMGMVPSYNLGSSQMSSLLASSSLTPSLVDAKSVPAFHSLHPRSSPLTSPLGPCFLMKSSFSH